MDPSVISAYTPDYTPLVFNPDPHVAVAMICIALAIAVVSILFAGDL